MKRVVITGTGMVSPLGNSVAESWNSIIAGKSGIQQYLNDPVLSNKNPYNLSLIKDFEYQKWKIPVRNSDTQHANSRLNSFLACATAEALSHSGLNIGEIQPEKVGICLGNMGSNETKITEFVKQSHESSYTNINRLSMLHLLSNIPVATLNVKYKLKGPSLTVSTACASGLSAIVEAYKWLKLGEAEIVIAGGLQEVYNPLCLNSSLRLQAMSTKVYDKPGQSSRPFDKQRSGFILGEGCGILILEEYQAAKKRGAEIIAEIKGYGYTSDGYHLVRPEGSGDGQLRAMSQAIKMANLTPDDIDNFNVHATSTVAGDQIEANAIATLTEKCFKKPSIVAYKSYLGHTFGAAGAIETILGLESMRNNITPKILNLEEIEGSNLNYTRTNQHKPINTFVKNSFGFGGINVSAVFQKL